MWPCIWIIYTYKLSFGTSRWLPNHKRHPKANSEAKSAAPSSDTDFPAAPGAVNTQLSGLSITRIYGSRYSSWSDLSVVASRCSESDPQVCAPEHWHSEKLVGKSVGKTYRKFIKKNIENLSRLVLLYMPNAL